MIDVLIPRLYSASPRYKNEPGKEAPILMPNKRSACNMKITGVTETSVV